LGEVTIMAKDKTKGKVKADMKDKQNAKVEEIQVSDQAVETPEVEKTAQKFGGRRKAVRVRDTTTGVVYASKSKAGKAVAAELGLDPDNAFVWYQVVKKAPDRFVEVDEG